MEIQIGKKLVKVQLPYRIHYDQYGKGYAVVTDTEHVEYFHSPVKANALKDKLNDKYLHMYVKSYKRNRVAERITIGVCIGIFCAMVLFAIVNPT